VKEESSDACPSLISSDRRNSRTGAAVEEQTPKDFFDRPRASPCVQTVTNKSHPVS